LHSGLDLKQVVKLPPGEEINDWIAVHGLFYACLKYEHSYIAERVKGCCVSDICGSICNGGIHVYCACVLGGVGVAPTHVCVFAHVSIGLTVWTPINSFVRRRNSHSG